MNRRKFINLLTRTALASLTGAVFYGAAEARWLKVAQVPVTLPRLPRPFEGLRIAFLSDIHHSMVVTESFIARAVEATNALQPDYVILGGDYITAGERYQGLGIGTQYIAPCFRLLKGLRPRRAVLAVTGNHDTRGDLSRVDDAIARAGFANLTNTGIWLESGGERLRLCGLGDLRTQQQRLRPALGDATDGDSVVMVTHNPDSAEELKDHRVSLILSGHTHGGQVYLPGLGSPAIPSAYGQKYRYGLVQGPVSQVYVTSGVGTLPLAFRFDCRPEIALLTLHRAPGSSPVAG